MKEPRTYHREFTAAGRCELKIERWPERFGSRWRALPWRRRLAWRIRGIADRIDRQLTYTIHGKLPSHVTQDDLWDAVTYGAAATQRYLNDLDQDRTEVPTDA